MRSARRGVALIGALGLLLLAAGLLAGTAVTAVELRSATRSAASTERAHAEGRRALGAIMQAWGDEEDSLSIGAMLERDLMVPAAAPAIAVHAQIQRLTAVMWAADVRVRVGNDPPALACRRMRLLLRRATDTAAARAAQTVTPVSPWSVIDLH